MRSELQAAAAFCLALLTPAAHADEHRQLGAHEHGHGTLNLAIEGTRVAIELEAPGADIVGFEHDPSTAEEVATVAAAKSTLAKPLDVLGVPAAAKCAIADAKVEIEDEEHTGEHTTEAHHSAFHAEYALECGDISAFNGLTLPYFDQFKSARSLSITIIAPKGQSKYEATREARTIKFGDAM